jgi:Major intrinsic protein
MALRSLNEEELERARNARPLNTVLKWRSGKLLRCDKLDRIRDVIGEKAYAETLAEIEASPTPDPFSNRAEYLHELARYEKIFQRRARQIKRWIKAGRYAKPAEILPLDAPTRKFLPHFDTMRACVERTLDTHSGQNNRRSLFVSTPILASVMAFSRELRSGWLASRQLFPAERCRMTLRSLTQEELETARKRGADPRGSLVKAPPPTDSFRAGSAIQSFVPEAILTAILMFPILGVSTGAAEKGIIAGIVVGAVIGLEAMFADPICGASMNPARSLAASCGFAAPAIPSGLRARSRAWRFYRCVRLPLCARIRVLLKRGLAPNTSSDRTGLNKSGFLSIQSAEINR